MRTRFMVLSGALVATLVSVFVTPAGLEASPSHPKLAITLSVNDVTTGYAIHSGDTIKSGDGFQVFVVTNNVDCAGQLVVTARGWTGTPPEVLMAPPIPFIVGPALGHNDAGTYVMTAGIPPGINSNQFKVSASCNGVGTGPASHEFAFDHFDFFVEA